MNYGALTVPSADAFVAVPSDTATQVATYLWSVDGGNVSVETEAGNIVTFTGVPAGTYLLVRCNKIRATGTTSSSLYGFKH